MSSARMAHHDHSGCGWMPEAVGRDLGPDVVRSTVGMAMELDLEQRPGDVHDDGAVSMPHGVPGVRGLTEPVALPGGLVGVPAESRGAPLEERGVVDGPLEERGARPDRSQGTAWPLSCSSSPRFVRLLPPANVAMTRGARGVHGPSVGWSRLHAPIPTVRATGWAAGPVGGDVVAGCPAPRGPPQEP